MKRSALAAIAVALATVLALMAPTPQTPARAADLSQFNPGNIISDAIFYNPNTMTEAQIQAFLLSKVPVCATGASCLINTTQTTWTRPADAMCAPYIGAPDEPVSRIIYKVAQACGINPQVLLVMLQKEQGLVTKSNPSMWSWQAAMGYGCPDTAPCDTEYQWFYNQVYKAASQLKRYGNPPGTSNYFTWYPVGAYSNVRYHPDASCGSSSVYIANKATAALYYYTPYQPNAAALAAGYGQASNPCSSYGNRNFFNYFSDWFGPTYSMGPTYIDQKYAALGGASGVLGAIASPHIEISANGGGVGRAYTGGSIYWTSTYGAWAVVPPYLGLYFAQNGSAGPWGWPTSDRLTLPGGNAQAFQFTSLYSKTGNPAYAVSGAIRSRYFADGGATGPLGWPTGEQAALSGTTGTRQAFEGGVILSRPTATVALVGPIGTYYAASSDRLGWPSSDVITMSGGVAQVFDNASVYSSSAGTWSVSGAMRTYYFSKGGSLGALGWPAAEASCVSSQCTQSFTGGTVYLSGSTGRIGLPAIEAVATARAADLGARTSELIAIAGNGGGFGQVHVNGSVYASAAGAWAVTGGIRTFYFAMGGSAGSLGWPTGEMVCSGGTCSQPFQRGSIYWSQAAGGWVGIPAIETYAAAHTAELGTRTSGAIAIGAGFGQAFTLGSVYSSGAGTWSVVGAIRSYYFGLGGAAGTLGWPTADAVCSSGSCSQSFQGGTIFWSSADGARVGLPVIEAYAAAHPEIGPRTSGLISIAGNGGGYGQAYQSASVYSSASGTWAVSGGIRAFYFSRGGSAGALGWPLADGQCTPTVCTQRFQGGTIAWDQATGGRIQ